MPRRKAKKVVKRANEDKNDDNPIQSEEKKEDFVDEEVERKIAAMKAIRDVQIENMLAGMELLQSSFTEEQLHTPVLQFFKENLPGLSLLKNEETGEIDLQRKNKDGDFISNADGDDINYSILKHLSMAYSRPSFGGYDLRDNASASLLGTDNTHLYNAGTFENPILASHDAFQTPGVNGQGLSVGMTPKTQRQPKPGELMLSVRGSPLGVYEEDHNMEPIQEETS